MLNKKLKSMFCRFNEPLLRNSDVQSRTIVLCNIESTGISANEPISVCEQLLAQSARRKKMSIN